MKSGRREAVKPAASERQGKRRDRAHEDESDLLPPVVSVPYGSDSQGSSDYDEYSEVHDSLSSPSYGERMAQYGPRQPDANTRLTAHEVLCAERYANILGRIIRLEFILLSVAGTLLVGMAALIWALLQRTIVWTS